MRIQIKMYDGSGFDRDGIKKIIPQLLLRYYFGEPFEVKDELFTCSNVTVLLCPL